MDLTLASVLLMVSGPALLLVALLIVLESPGSPIYRQLRRGQDQVPFRLFKFRSMRDGAHRLRSKLFGSNQVDGIIFKMALDPRVTRLGRFLRRFSIDEVPQLLNVLRGEMSLVGPRPFSVEVFERKRPDDPRYDRWLVERHQVRPGLTGLWQVSGRSDLPFEELVTLDLHYVRHQSPWLDLEILLRSFRAVFSKKGAY